MYMLDSQESSLGTRDSGTVGVPIIWEKNGPIHLYEGVGTTDAPQLRAGTTELQLGEL